MSLAQLITTQCERNGWSLKHLVERAAQHGFKTSKAQWSNWRNEVNRPSDVESFLKIAAGIGVDPAVVYTAAGASLGVAPAWLIPAVAELVSQVRLQQAGGDVVHFSETEVTQEQLGKAIKRARAAISRRHGGALRRSSVDRPTGTVPGPSKPGDDAQTPSARQ